MTSDHKFTLTVTELPPVATPDPVELDVDVPESQTPADGAFADVSEVFEADNGDFAIPSQRPAGYVAGPDGPVKVTGSTFVIDTTSGELSLAADADPNTSGDQAPLLDFESGVIPGDYSLVITRAASGGTETAQIGVIVTDVNEAPMFSAAAEVIEVYTEETAALDTVLSIGVDASGNNPTSIDASFTATDQDDAATGNVIAYQLLHDHDNDGATPMVEYTGDDAIVYVDGTGTIKVNKALETDGLDGISMVNLTLQAYDPGTSDDPATEDVDEMLYDTLAIRVIVLDRNVAPVFDAASLLQKSVEIPENAQPHVIFTYFATDEDGDDVEYALNDLENSGLFTIGVTSGELSLAGGLNFEKRASHSLFIEAYDTDDDERQGINLAIIVEDVNDEPPMLEGPSAFSVPESTKPNTVIARYSVTDDDTVGDISVTLSGDSGYMIERVESTNDWELTTTGWLDYDTNGMDTVSLTASDGSPITIDDEINVSITINDMDDSISNIRINKANPVPGTKGSSAHALDDNPANYVRADWANWGTTLRIEVKRQSPDPECNANCVFIDLEADSSGATRTLEARRTLTQNAGNVFVAAVTLVEDYGDAQDNDMDAGVTAYLKVDEEDEIDIRFGNARGSVDVENEAPEITNFAPEHEAAFDDGDVDYTFTVTDAVSGIPEPEDLPDGDGDGDYTAVAALVSEEQCDNVTGIGNADLTLPDGKQIKCNDSTLTVRPIVDDKDFDSIDDGFDVETTIVLTEGEVHYVTFIACDAAGNCAVYDPDENTADEALPEITVDDEAPEFDEARAGVTWNATDNEYDDNRAFIQLIFNDLTALNPATVEVDDFVVEGHTIKAVHMFDPDSKDTLWGDVDENGNLDMSTTPTRFGRDAKYQQIDRSVFVELEDELAPDETPDVAVVPNGVEDQAGHDQDDGEHEADDWIAPDFTVVSIVSPRVTGQSEVLAGEDDQVVFTVTSDERLDASRPSVEVTYVNAPDGCVETKDSDDYDRGEIKTGGSCGGSATGTGLNPTIEKVSNTEWVITIDKPKATGYYNFFISGFDRSSANRNEGSEGVSADNIETDFFKKNGDVNTDDAYFFEADLNLSNPEVKISGEMAGDVEPTVEFRSPLFIGIDFTRTHSAPQDCDAPMSDRENCLAESDEYAEDNYDSVTITSFMLDGVDLTDSVKTTDDETFLLALDNIGVGEHELSIQAMDAAGNTLDDALEIEFEIEERGPFEKRLSPGWNLVSLPGEPADSSIDAVFGSGVEVRTVYTYDPVVPGGWMVAVRETVDGDWQGDLMEITGQRGYWVLSDAIQDWEVSIPRLAGGSGGTGTPIQPPSIPLYAGWNLIPVTDVTGEFDDDIPITVGEYLNSLDDGLDLARVLGFDTIRNDWSTLTNGDNVEFGKGYWVFVREAGTLVPGK